MKIFTIFLVLLIATLTGILIKQDPGYALFSYKNWTIEMPLWLSVVGLIAVTLLLFFVFKFLNFIFSSKEKIEHWWQERQKGIARIKTGKGLIELAEGRWKKAERFLLQGAALSDVPMINYLSAAKAAEAEGALERRDKYLELALNASTGSEIAVKITQAQLQYRSGQLEQSAQTLKALHEESPHNPKILRLLCTLYEAMGDWWSLFDLLPYIRKDKIMPEEALQKLEERVCLACLKQGGLGESLTNLHNLSNLKAFWKMAPRSVWSNPQCVSAYAKCLVKCGAEEEAEKLIRKTLQYGWHDELVKTYGELPIVSLPKSIGFMESWIKIHPENPTLLFALGKLCLKAKLWGKARDYLEDSLRLKPTPEGYRALGELYDYLGQVELKNDCFRKGLIFATEGGAEGKVLVG